MPKKTIGEVEEFYIREHKHLTARKIASKIDGVGVKSVEAYLATLGEGDESQEQEASAYEETVPAIKDQEDQDRQTAGELLGRNKEYGVVIMTQEASEIADETREVEIKEEPSSDRVHRIRND
tara:strand:+ start:243 stop:611 length:369 start_codon:yes stop_codon:yes gene_type:complete